MSHLVAHAGTSSRSSGSSDHSSYVPSRRTFAHASTFHAGMTTHTSGLTHTTPALALGARIFDPAADIDQATAQQRAELQKTARQVRLSVSRGYCVSTPQHSRANSFASTLAPSSEHPSIDGTSSAHSTVGELPLPGRSALVPWSRTQSAPVAKLGQPRPHHPALTPSPAPSFKNDGDFRAKELQPYASGPQRPWEPTLSSQSSFARHASTQSAASRRARFASSEDEGDITAISLEPARLGKSIEAGAGALDSVLGAHFEADAAFESGFAVDRADRQGSSSDEEEPATGNSSSQSEDEDEFPADPAPEASTKAGPSSKTDSLARSLRRAPLSSRPNGLAGKTTSLPAGPFDAASRIDEDFTRRTALRHGLETRTRTLAAVGTPVSVPSRLGAGASTVENDFPPWSEREFQRWASSSDF